MVHVENGTSISEKANRNGIPVRVPISMNTSQVGGYNFCSQHSLPRTMLAKALFRKLIYQKTGFALSDTVRSWSLPSDVLTLRDAYEVARVLGRACPATPRSADLDHW
jgi:hypothetical protein